MTVGRKPMGEIVWPFKRNTQSKWWARFLEKRVLSREGPLVLETDGKKASRRSPDDLGDDVWPVVGEEDEEEAAADDDDAR